ncbi:Dot/Icm T4SS effector AnkC/LegA12 [Legionella hackeliae]|uniref:Uncharacterized protein n=1 Tax=Legionella hackeliae TaxID=449 RepID=A0A0A8USE9_LEGHA|nr:Dot/Icm T4SS effector AnkC/LegA12 [Legionella hackeliae]KTD10189.1 ankyrin repeat protein [Legionella hackeliae]CEK09684.1 conserved protein of unknown function [ankyrin repeat] [Legionella hackeliae]STX49594.1 ankyrin repeat protein [Legionella hackeliae]
MNLFDEINQAITEGMEAFVKLIQNKVQQDENFLRKVFFTTTGKQQTVLEYLIQMHSEECNVTNQIEWLLQQTIDINANEPLHLIFQLKKLDLVPLFLKEHLADDKEPRQRLNLNTRDIKGKQLIYRIIESGNIDYLELAIKQGINIHLPSPSEVGSRSWEIQPVHQAVLSGFSNAIPLLIQAGAELSNPFGELMESPLLLAARHGQINAMKELLVHYQSLDLKSNQEFISVVDKDRYSAMDRLCIRVHDNKKPKEALHGIAMLLCHGAEVAAHPLLRSLLMDNRHELFAAVKEYTKEQPKLAATFLRKCYNKQDPLHDIMFAKNSWGQTFRHLVGKADGLGLELPFLIQSSSQKPSTAKVEESELVDEKNQEVLTQEEALFTEFIKRYKQVLKTSFFNPWSEMLHLIAKGEVTCWEHAKAYAEMHPGSRTARIVVEMTKTTHSIHVSLDQTPLLQ